MFYPLTVNDERYIRDGVLTYKHWYAYIV